MSLIRKAHRGDAKNLATLAESTFRATFGAVNLAENMEQLCQSSFSEDIQAGEISDPDMLTLLSEQENHLIGFAQLRWGPAPDCVVGRSPGEIQRLYVANDWHGKGIAHDLMSACIAEIKGRGSEVVWLGVWEQNPRAISFYKKFGFVEVGDHIFPVGSDPQRDIVMARSVASSTPDMKRRDKNVVGQAKYQQMWEVTAGVIKSWDPYNLLSDGAPTDEFDQEISLVVAQIPRMHSEADTVRAISQIFSTSFEAELFTEEMCSDVGGKLYAALVEQRLIETAGAA